MSRSAPLLLALLVLSIAPGPGHPSPVAKETRKVLLLFSQERGHPAHDLTEQGIRQTFRSNPAFDVDLYIEYLDDSRFSDPARNARMVRFLQEKYADRKIDAIISVYPAAENFLLENGNELFPRVPIVACEVAKGSAGIPEGSPSRDRVIRMIFGENTGHVLETALRMRPGTKRIALVGGISRGDVAAEQLVRTGLKPFLDRLELIDLTKLPMENILSRVAALPPDSVVFYAVLFRDGSGRSFVPREALSLISRASNAPVFGLFDSYMGFGIVGGPLASFERQGGLAAGLVLRVLSGESPDAIRAVQDGNHLLQFDGRELSRWKIPDSAVPAGSTVLYREDSLWTSHRKGILGVLAVMVLQFALISGLVFHRFRRRSAERALQIQKDELARVNERLREEAAERERIQADLHSSREEYRNLAGNLLISQEAERRRLARELHDDTTQRLAALSIDVGTLEGEVRDSRGPLGERLRRIGKELMRLSGDVHTMSRRLHPSILDDLGLVEAVRAECARFSRREGIAVSIDAGNVPGDLPGNVKLCVYRILQEALRNVARHAGATRVRILLTDEGGLLRLAVEDDGKGFSPQGMDRRAGLGLISMKERTQQVGGDFSLDSGPGRGTVIRITVPTAAPGTPGWEAEHRERRSGDG